MINLKEMSIWILLGLFSIYSSSSGAPIHINKKIVRKLNYFNYKATNAAFNDRITSVFHKNLSNVESIPKNIVLMIVEGHNEEDSWRQFKDNYVFPVHGFLMDCLASTLLNDPIITNDNNCDCHEQLKKNINELITWIQLNTEINIETIVSDNSTLQTILNDENSITISQNSAENTDYSEYKTTNHLLQSQSENFWHSNDSNNYRAPLMLHSIPMSLISPLSVLKDLHNESINNDKIEKIIENEYDINNNINMNNIIYAIRNFFNYFSQMNFSFFKTVFNIMREKAFNYDTKFLTRIRKSSIPVQPRKYAGHIFNRLMNLQLTSNNNGFLMVAVIPGAQLSAVYEAIKHQIFIDNTLMIITGICNQDNNSQKIPFMASGPQSKFIDKNISTIIELPIALKLILSHCADDCKNKTSSLSDSYNSDTLTKRIARFIAMHEMLQNDEKPKRRNLEAKTCTDINKKNNKDAHYYQLDLDILRETASSAPSYITSYLTRKFILIVITMFAMQI